MPALCLFHSQVRLSLERAREELQRQVASLDSQLAIARARLEDAGSEASSLNQVHTVLQGGRCVQPNAYMMCHSYQRRMASFDYCTEG